MTDGMTTPEHLLRRADEALDNADWDAARTLFSEALEERETPEALEGRAKAAFRDYYGPTMNAFAAAEGERAERRA
jgi:hypothetical protein